MITLYVMATYAIGDLHGNLEALKRLLDTIDFDAGRDRLWFVGDLVNRGPDSLGCLRFVRALGDCAVCVLGNHDLALLVWAHRPRAAERINTDLAPILAATDGPELLHWLRHRPLLHQDSRLDWVMVHAGIPAEWTLSEAQAHAHEVETALRGPQHEHFLSRMFGDEPALWETTLTGMERLRYITNALTRQRFVYPDQRLDMAHKATLAAAPASLQPWFTLPGRHSADQRIVFGHWAALSPIAWPEHRVWCIDTGAAWGGQLTALRLDADAAIISVPG